MDNYENSEVLENTTEENANECCDLCLDSSSMWMIMGACAVGSLVSNIVVEGLKLIPKAAIGIYGFTKKTITSITSNKKAVSDISEENNEVESED